MNPLHAEWTKLRTLRGTVWLLLAIVVATVAVSAITAAGANCPVTGCSQDPARMSLAGVDLGQAVAAVLAVLVISSEYSSGLIGVTLTAMPRRTSVLAAKAAVLTGLVLAAGTVAVAGSLLAGRLILPGHGFTPVHGFAAVLSLSGGPVLRAATGSVLYLVLIALLSLGVATAVREPAAAIGVILGVVFLFPVVAAAVDPRWHRFLEQAGPMTAGLAIQATTGLGVLAAWAAAALLAGSLLLRWRDA
jgi:ABC-2 type transport system permease protein